jgi:CHAT domain-containing protein
LADLLLQRAALMTEDSEAGSYLKAARDAIEAYKAAELRDYFRDDCVDQMQARVTKLDAVSPATAIIYPIMFSDRTELLVSFPGRPQTTLRSGDGGGADRRDTQLPPHA